jgi:hypothetical protein
MLSQSMASGATVSRHVQSVMPTGLVRQTQPRAVLQTWLALLQADPSRPSVQRWTVSSLTRPGWQENGAAQVSGWSGSQGAA